MVKSTCPGRIDDIQSVIVPFTAGGSRLNRNTTLLLLIHEVGGRRTIVDFTDFVDLAGELQNPLGGGGFTGVNMGKNADVPITVQVCHGGIPLIKIKNL